MPVTYVIPRVLLAQSARDLQPAEQVRFVTGIRLQPQVIVLTQLLCVRVQRSRTHAHPKPADVWRLHERLLLLGHDIEAQFHSHPGTTADATLPSPTDVTTARCWENGAPFLGAIFSSNGRYVRFFNHNQQSTIHVYGNQYTWHDPDLVELL